MGNILSQFTIITMGNMIFGYDIDQDEKEPEIPPDFHFSPSRWGYGVRKMFRINRECDLYKRIVKCYGDFDTFINEMDVRCQAATNENEIQIGFWYNAKRDIFFITNGKVRPSYGELLDNTSFLVMEFKSWDTRAYVPAKYLKKNQQFSEYGINWGLWSKYFDQRLRDFKRHNAVKDDWEQFYSDYWRKYESNWPTAPSPPQLQ